VRLMKSYKSTKIEQFFNSWHFVSIFMLVLNFPGFFAALQLQHDQGEADVQRWVTLATSLVMKFCGRGRIAVSWAGFSVPQNGVKLAGPFFCFVSIMYKPDIQFQTSPLVTSVWTHSHNSFGQESGIDVPERDGNNRMEGRHREIFTNRFIGCLIGSIRFTWCVCSLVHDTEIGMTKTVVMRMQGR